MAGSLCAALKSRAALRWRVCTSRGTAHGRRFTASRGARRDLETQLAPRREPMSAYTPQMGLASWRMRKNL